MSCEGCPKAGSCSKDAGTCGVQPNPKNKIRSIVAVMSGKGGVGKSTVTVLLARALTRMGIKTGILDADLTGPSIPRLLMLENQKAYATAENEILPVVHADGIKIMSLNYLLKSENDPVIWRGPVISNVLRQFYTDVLWEELDVLLIDMPPGTGDVALTILQDLPVEGVVMVSTPQPMVSMIVSKAVHMCEQMNIPVLGIIENMAYMECPHCHHEIQLAQDQEVEEFAASLNVPLLACLPDAGMLRDLNQFDIQDLASQEKILDSIQEAAEKMMAELKNPSDLKA